MQQCTLLCNIQLHNKRKTKQVVPIAAESNPNNFAAGHDAPLVKTAIASKRTTRKLLILIFFAIF